MFKDSSWITNLQSLKGTIDAIKITPSVGNNFQNLANALKDLEKCINTIDISNAAFFKDLFRLLEYKDQLSDLRKILVTSQKKAVKSHKVTPNITTDALMSGDFEAMVLVQKTLRENYHFLEKYNDKWRTITESMKYATDRTKEFTQQYDRLTNSLEELDALSQHINPENATPEQIFEFVQKSYKLRNLIEASQYELNKNANLKLVKDTQRSKLESDIAQWRVKNSAAEQDFGKELDELVRKLKTADHVEFNHLIAEFNKVKIRAQEAGKTGLAFFDQWRQRMKNLAVYMSSFASFYDIINFLRRGITVIRELDSAMVQLRKVSDETNATYEQFQSQMAETAKSIASTNKELLNSAADYVRLGQTIEEAGELAKNTAIYVNVGDGIDINAATEDMITAMKAFDIKAEESMKIVDSYNQIGNTFAISSSGIGEAMKRSASALEAGNNTFEESIALITAMNEIVQNEENTGNTLKVLSLRLRGASAELEEMGEETDGLCESSSRLQEKLLALTGVDIMLDDDTFKSTTQIMRELGVVWDNMTDVSQAAALELIAGKTRANNVKALLKNYKQIDKVLEELGNAEGSALKENAAIVDSIEGRIQILSAQAEEFWQTFIETDTLKNAISLVTELLSVLTKLIDTVGAVPTLAVPLFAGLHKLSPDLLPLRYDSNNGIYTVFDTLKDRQQKLLPDDNDLRLIKKAQEMDARGVTVDKMLTWAEWNTPRGEQLSPFGKEYFQKLQDGTESIKNAGQYLDDATKKANAFKGALKEIALNAGAMIAVTVAVTALAKIWDHLNVTLEEQQEIVDNLNADISELQTQYDELHGKGNLTAEEERRLEILERQLEIKKELLAIEQQELTEKELRQDNSALLTDSDGIISGSGKNALDFERLKKQFETNRDRINNGGYSGWALDSFIQEEQDIITELEANRASLQEQWQAQADRRDKIKSALDNGVWDHDPEAKKYWEQQLKLADTEMNNLQEMIDEHDFTLGLTVDVDVAKDHIKTFVKDIDVKWLNTLSDEELTYLFRIEDIGKYSPQDLRDMIKTLREDAKTPIEVQVASTSGYISDLEELSDGFEKVITVYNDVKDAGEFDFSALADNSEFITTFQDAGDALTDFVDIVSKSPSDINACQSAFDNLVTEWFYAQDPLKNITEETYDLTVAWLKQKGVANAAEVATHALKVKEQETFYATHDLEEITADASGSFDTATKKLLAEAKQAGLTGNALINLRLKLISLGKTNLNLSQQIEEIRKMGTEAGLSSAKIAAVMAMVENADAVTDLGTYQGQLARNGKSAAEIQEITGKQAGYNMTAAAMEAAEDMIDEINKMGAEIDTSGFGSVGSSGGGGGGSASEPWSAEIDKYEKYTRVIDELSSTLSDLNRAYEHTDDIEERIALKNKEIELYAQQQKAIEDLNNARDKEIGANVNKLRGKGFKIDYDPLTDSLVIHNKELINTMKASDDAKQELWKLIEASEELNDANKESTEQWKELSYSILESRDALEELHNERFDEAIADAEHLIELFSKRGDVVDEDLQLMGGIMTALEKELQDLMKQGTEADKDRIKELQKMWMDYYDSRIERENELLEKQLEDRDGVLSAIDNLFNERIENIDKEIKALQKTNEERKSAIELQKAQAALDAAKSQKTRKVLIKGKGFVWEADDDAIKEAEENLADLEFEQSIETLEKQKESLEEIRNMWAEIPDEFEKYQNKLLAEERLGADWEEDVLDGRISVYNDFKDEYFDIQKKIYENTKELNEHMADEYQKMIDQFAKMIAMFNVPEAAVGGAIGSSNKSWYVNKDGKAPSQANVGDLVYTKGGIYRIDSKDENGKFKSTRIDATPQTIPEGMWGKEIQTVSSTIASIYDELKNLQKGGNVNLLNRPEVSSKVMQNAGWDTEDGSISTVNTSTYSNRDGSVAMNFTPIQVDKNGKLVRVLGEDELQRYAEAVIDGAHDDYLGLKIGQTFTGKNAISNAEAEAQRIHKLHEALTTDETGVNFNDSLAINALSTEGLIREAEDVNERIKASILSSDELRDYMKKNTDVTWKDVDAILENADFTHRLSGETDDNTDATDDNTQALRDLIYKLANLEFEVPLEEMTLENFDDNIMDETDQAYIKELQKAWNLAMEQGNVELANQIHAMADEARMRYLDDDPNNDYNAIAESISKLADSKYEYSYSTQIGGKNGDSEATQKYLDNINWLRGKADWSDDFIDRLDNVVDAIENGSGLTAKVYEDQYGRTSTVIEYTDKKTPNTNKTSGSSGSKKTSGQQAMDNHGMSDSDRNAIAAAQKKYNEAKTQAEKDAAHREAEAIRNKYGYSGGTDGSENIKTTSANTRSVSENTKATTYNADSTNDNTDSIDSNTDSVDKNTAEHAKGYKVDVNVNVSGGSSGGSSGGGGSKGNGKGNGGSPSDSGSYKMDNNPNSPTFGVKVKQKAKGGVNLRGDVYNVDEKGPELLIEPDEGRFVRIRKGGSVIPADVSKKLWEFGANPKAFMDNIVSKNIIKVNPQIVDVTAAATSGSGTVQNNYHIGSMALPNVQDVNGFIRDIQNLPNLAKQYMTKK